MFCSIFKTIYNIVCAHWVCMLHTAHCKRKSDISKGKLFCIYTYSVCNVHVHIDIDRITNANSVNRVHVYFFICEKLFWFLLAIFFWPNCSSSLAHTHTRKHFFLFQFWSSWIQFMMVTVSEIVWLSRLVLFCFVAILSFFSHILVTLIRNLSTLAASLFNDFHNAYNLVSRVGAAAPENHLWRGMISVLKRIIDGPLWVY